MKIFNDWKENDISSFIFFLAKESKRHKSKMREYYQKLKEGDPEVVHLYHLQQGMAVEADTIYALAKMTFGFEEIKMKKYKKEIDIIDEQIFVKILDIDNKVVCLMNFDKNYIMRLGNRYLEEPPYCITDQSSELDEMFHFIILDIQEKLNLTKFTPLQNKK